MSINKNSDITNRNINNKKIQRLIIIKFQGKVWKI